MFVPMFALVAIGLAKWSYFKRGPQQRARIIAGFLLAMVMVWTDACTIEARGMDPDDAATVPKLLSRYCLGCHGSDMPKAGFRLDNVFVAAAENTDHLLAWKEVLSRLEARDMPPSDHPRPSEIEYESLSTSVQKVVERLEQLSRSKMPKAMRRLNRVEYANTIRDLFGILYRPGEDFPIDGTSQGFDTVAEGQSLSPALLEKQLATANAVLDRAFQSVAADHKPRTVRYAFYEEHYTYPVGTSLSGLGVYNGNSHLSFGPAGKSRVVYVGGPALFAYSHIDPINNPVHAFHSEGLYKLRATLTPQNFEPGEVASFSVLGAEKRHIGDFDIEITRNGQPITIEAEGYYDRTESLVGFEINWTNGNHLQWPSRGRLARRPNPLEGSDINKPWAHIHYKKDGDRLVEWSPQAPEELPFSYFEKVEFELIGPFREMPKQSAELLGDYSTDRDPSKVFARFLPKAFRRPVTQSELDRYTAMVTRQIQRGQDPIDALKLGMAAALCSPHFLLMVELPSERSSSGLSSSDDDLLNDYEFATRLSYFLWSSCPDEELRRFADAGTLREEKNLDRQVARMLADPRSRALADGFARQWLNLDKLSSTMPEPKLFPYWSDELRDSCREETLAFFREVLASNRPVTDFLSSDWTYVNESLAMHYGLAEVTGRRLRKVQLTDDRRGGLLTQAAILTLTSEATRTAPVIRGAYVLDRLFHRPPPPPPPNVGALIPDASEARSVREHLELHRAAPACAGCHAKFDGYGLALENFDATGRWRIDEPVHEDPAKPVQRNEADKLPRFPIHALGELADGSKLESVSGLKKHLLAKKEEFIRGLAERLTIYACGRSLYAADRRSIEAVVQATVDDGASFHTLIREVVDTPAFRTR